MIYRIATQADVPLLAELNYQLIRDEGHRNLMTIPQLAERMGTWIESEYTAIIFEEENEAVAYGLYRNSSDGIYLRQLFVQRDHRRRGIGRRAIHLLFNEIWAKDKRTTVEVLSHNAIALSFWRAVGFSDYSITLEKLPG